MSLDEKLWGIIWRAKNRIFNQNTSLTTAVELEEIRNEITRFLDLVSSSSFRIAEAKGMGSVSENCLFLPSKIATFDSKELNHKAYFYRTLFSIELHQYQRENRLTVNNQGALFPLALLPLIHKRLQLRYPTFKKNFEELFFGINKIFKKENTLWQLFQESFETQVDLLEKIQARIAQLSKFENTRFDLAGIDHYPLKTGFPFWGLLNSYSKKKEISLAQQDGKVAEESFSKGTEKKSKAVESTEEVRLNENADHLPTPQILESTKTADDFMGGMKELDASDELADHMDAINELDMKKVVRSKMGAKSILRSEVTLSTSDISTEDEEYPTQNTFHYDEWDYRSRSYRKNWCRVFEDNSDSRDELRSLTQVPDQLRSTIEEARRKILRLKADFFLKHRQLSGTDLDIDACITRHCDLISRKDPGNRIYINRTRRLKDTRIMLLLDQSLSTDSWVDGRRVLDIEQDAIFVIGEALKEFSRDFSISSFYSFTRRSCHFRPIKKFEENWSAGVSNLSKITPKGYTRVGPAIRHATTLLRGEKSEKKGLILLSDGKATDYDSYEGRYGIQDVRQAVLEARREGIWFQCLAIDTSAKAYLPKMFGAAGFQVLSHPQALSPALLSIFQDAFKK